jgi:subtilase family serine protease
VTDAAGTPLANATPRGAYGPADLRAAYVLGTAPRGAWVWNGQTVAIVDAFGYPSAEDDLKVYRAYYGLPPCTTANGCFRKIDQRGGKNYPRSNCGWAQETALDIQMVSATCPQCKILLVQSDSNSFANLGAAVNQADAQGADVISNSYGSAETAGGMSYASYYDHPGVAVTVSSGDSGYGVEVPAAFNTVTAVGGTSLKRASTTVRGWTETAWSGAGSGCSSYVAKPSWQTDACPHRTVADVSAVADPATGVAVYDSLKCQGVSGWLTFGGTSVAAPIIAGIYGAAGSASTADPGSPVRQRGGVLRRDEWLEWSVRRLVPVYCGFRVRRSDGTRDSERHRRVLAHRRRATAIDGVVGADARVAPAARRSR